MIHIYILDPCFFLHGGYVSEIYREKKNGNHMEIENRFHQYVRIEFTLKYIFFRSNIRSFNNNFFVYLYTISM